MSSIYRRSRARVAASAAKDLFGFVAALISIGTLTALAVAESRKATAAVLVMYASPTDVSVGQDVDVSVYAYDESGGPVEGLAPALVANGKVSGTLPPTDASGTASGTASFSAPGDYELVARAGAAMSEPVVIMVS